MITRMHRGEQGVYAILFALLITVLVGVVAIVVDIGLLRSDRRIDKNATDAAAIAGAAQLGSGTGTNPKAACLAALGYLQQNLPGASGSPSSLCDNFPAPGQIGYAACPSSALSGTGTLTGNGGSYQVTITWPVPDASPLMLPDIRPLAAGVTQPAVAADGTPCTRFGVAISHTRATLFAGIFGDNSGGTSNHSVALVEIGSGKGGVAAPLVILDPHACKALTASGGGGGGGGVEIAANGDIPGVIAVNSDGTGSNCGGQTTVINSNAISGSQSRIWAFDSASSGAPASILSYAVHTGASDAYDPAQVTCASSSNPSGPLCPQPSSLLVPVDRTTFIDNRYNCGILPENCPAQDDGIGQLRSFAEVAINAVNSGSSPSGFDQVLSTPAQCKPSADVTYSTTVYVNCTGSQGFNVATGVHVNFTGPTVVFGGNVTVQSGGCLLFNVVKTSTVTDCTTPDVSLLSNEASDGPVVFIAGTLSVKASGSAGSGGGSFIAPQTFVMVGDCSFSGGTCATPQPIISMGGSGPAGNIVWSAPLGPPTAPSAQCLPGIAGRAPSSACFANLALWDEYAAPSNGPDVIIGGATLILQGTFFTPNAAFKLGGGSNTDIENAQFITGTLNIVGGAVLTMHPNAALTNPPPLITAALIR